METYVVVGAAGWTGRACVETLLHQGCNVRAVVRDPDRARAVYRTQPMLTGLSLRDAQPPVKERLEIVQGDALDRDSLQRALVGCAGVIYAATSSGWTQLSAFWRTMRTTRPEDVDFQGVKNVAEVALEQGCVERVVLVSARMVSPHRRWHPARLVCNFLLRWRLMDWKWAGEEALRHSGVPYTIVRPDYIVAKPPAPTLLVVEQGDNNNDWQSTSIADLAAVCVAALNDPAARNVTLELFSKRQQQQQQGQGAAAAVPPLKEQIPGVFKGLVPDASSSPAPAGR